MAERFFTIVYTKEAMMTADSMTGLEAVERLYRGTLIESFAVNVPNQYRGLIGDRLWLCPNDMEKAGIRAHDPQALTCNGDDLFHLISLVQEDGEGARSVITVFRLFGGWVLPSSRAVVDDHGADIDPAGSLLWIKLLTEAMARSNDFYARLSYIRAGGALLERDERTGYLIKPIIDTSGSNGWRSISAWEAERLCLYKYSKELSCIFKKMAEEVMVA